MNNLLSQLVNDRIQAKDSKDLLSFIQANYPTEFIYNWFHEVVCRKLDKFLNDVINLKSPRILLSVPPRHTKSDMVSVFFPAYVFGKYPDLSMISTSYSASLASSFNRKVQRIIDTEKYKQTFDTRIASPKQHVSTQTWLRNSEIFEIVNRLGIYRCAGVGGSITGAGAHILLIDDAIKDDEEASSPTIREKIWDWFTSVAYTRLAPGGGCIVIMTRWHTHDLIGRLTEEMRNGGEEWEIISFPAIAERKEEFREVGEALQPDRYSIEQLNRIKQTIGTRKWLSMYQQRPTIEGGSIVKLQWFNRYLELPSSFNRIVFSIDTAYKPAQHNDPSVCEVWGVTGNSFFLLYIWKSNVGYPELKKNIISLAEEWHPNEILIENAASGQSLIQDLKQNTKYPVIAMETERLSKILRMDTESPAIEAGKCYLPKSASWLYEFEQEVMSFPVSTHDDCVDAMSQFLKRQRTSQVRYDFYSVSNSRL